ncbi:TolC family protein [Magnetovibrio blakemorei]|nr:TolC family protein [Magnetovibrio blakemorei]
MIRMKTFKSALLGSVFAVTFSMSLAGSVSAASLMDDVAAMLSVHERIKAAEADVAAARANLDVSKGGYYPTASITSNVGHEKIYTQNPLATATKTSMAQREVDLGLKQTLFDFGATDASVEGSSLSVDQALATLEQTRQAVLLAGLSAQLNLASAKRVLDHQIQSEANIKRQTDLEHARVEIGSGISTNELQSKTQLAGAQAARVRAQGALRQAVNRYRAVFETVPADLEKIEVPDVSRVVLPTSEEELVRVALEDNPQVLVTSIAAEIANATIASSFATGYRPVVTASVDQKYKRDVGGTIGDKNEMLVKVEATFDFNMGWTAQNTLLAAKSSHSAAASRLKDTRNQIEEQARNAWQRLETARLNADFLENQAHIATEFLGLARKELALGQRSLIDVLSGETSLINALVAADRAKTDVDIAILTVLNTMGKLELSVLQ